MNEREKRRNQLIGAVVFLGALFALGMITSRQSPEERITAQVRRHFGAIVFVRSDSGADEEFLAAIEDIRPLMRGAAALISISRREAEFLGPETQAAAPALVVIEAHGLELNRFHGSLDEADRSRLEESVRRIAWHQRATAGGRLEDPGYTGGAESYGAPGGD